MYNILICDDDRDIVEALKIYLSGEDYRLFAAYNGQEALELVRQHEIHCILMDVMMPKMDGITATAALRRESNVPIILLTAKSESSDKVLGLNIGADDYVTKPFDPVEVQARVRSQLRRYTLLGARAGTEEAGVYTVGNVSLNEETKRVTVDGETVTLTPWSTTSCTCSSAAPGASTPPPRSTRPSGTRIPWGRRPAWRCTSVTSGRRSRSTPPTPAT